jgi:hypothetical protein
MCRCSDRVHNHDEIPSGWKACSASNRKSRRSDFGLFKLQTNVRSVSSAWPCPLYSTLPQHPRFVEIEKLPLAMVPCGHLLPHFVVDKMASEASLLFQFGRHRAIHHKSPLSLEPQPVALGKTITSMQEAIFGESNLLCHTYTWAIPGA